jgi:magnesium transporter
MIEWIEITGNKLSWLAELGVKYKINPLAIEDCFHKDQRPKFENFEVHQFLVWFMISNEKFYEIQFIIFPDKLIFISDDEPPRGETWRQFFKIGSEYKDVWHMVYSALDIATDATWEEVRRKFIEIEGFEQAIFQDTFDPRAVINLKKTLNRIEAIIEHLPSIPKQLEKFYTLKNDLFWKLRDLHDHCERMYTSVMMHSSQIGMVIDLYWGYQSDRVNRQMKKLTLLASVAIPLTFWASFWGMNFNIIPFSSTGLFLFAMGIMIFSVIIAIRYLVKKGYWSD